MLFKNRVFYFNVKEIIDSYFNAEYLKRAREQDPECDALSNSYFFSRSITYRFIRLKKEDEKWFFADDFRYDGDYCSEICIFGVVFGVADFGIARLVKDWESKDIVSSTEEFWF